MKIPVIIYMMVLLFLTVAPLIKVNAQLSENLRVRVDLIETFSDGTLNSSLVNGAQVTVIRIETGESWTALTEGGWARFWLDYTGQYNLTIAYMNYTHIPKSFYIDDINRITYIYDSIYKLAKFLRRMGKVLAQLHWTIQSDYFIHELHAYTKIFLH